jgi:hypothetical protein
MLFFCNVLLAVCAAERPPNAVGLGAVYGKVIYIDDCGYDARL